VPDYKALQRAARARQKEMSTPAKVAIPKSKSKEAVRRKALADMESKARKDYKGYGKHLYVSENDFGTRKITRKEMESKKPGFWGSFRESGSKKFARRAYGQATLEARNNYLNEEARAKRRKKR